MKTTFYVDSKNFTLYFVNGQYIGRVPKTLQGVLKSIANKRQTKFTHKELIAQLFIFQL